MWSGRCQWRAERCCTYQRLYRLSGWLGAAELWLSWRTSLQLYHLSGWLSAARVCFFLRALVASVALLLMVRVVCQSLPGEMRSLFLASSPVVTLYRLPI